MSSNDDKHQGEQNSQIYGHDLHMAFRHTYVHRKIFMKLIQKKKNCDMAKEPYPKIEANIGVRNVSELSFVKLPECQITLIRDRSFLEEKIERLTIQDFRGTYKITFGSTVEVYTIADGTPKYGCIKEC